MSNLKSQLEALRLDDDTARPRRRKWPLIVLGLVLAAAGLFAWRARTATAAIEVQTVAPVVRQATAGGGAPMLTASGYIVARRKAVVSAKIQGRLADLRVEEGSRVKEGEVIARLESADYEAALGRARARVEAVRAQIASAEARIKRAEADLAEAQRQVRLADRLTTEQIVSTDSRDAARSRVAQAEAALAQARADHTQTLADLAQAEADVRFADAQLQNTVIRAPFSGTVVKKMAEVGESVAPIPPGVNISTSSGAVVALADLDTLEVEVDVSESNVARLDVAQPAEVTVEAFPGRTYRASLRQVIPTADRTKATVLVKVTILDRDPNLKPEMSAKATFMERAIAGAGAEAQRFVLVPQQAVVTRDGTPVVFEVANDAAHARKVTLGSAQQGLVVVTSGLSGGERLVGAPPATLKDGAQVRVKGAGQ